MFIGLMRYNQKYGSPFKLCFGPKSFLTISDPVQMKHILRDANTNYDKGILAEILKPIMGKGLIPADPVTWYVCFSTKIAQARGPIPKKNMEKYLVSIRFYFFSFSSRNCY